MSYLIILHHVHLAKFLCSTGETIAAELKLIAEGVVHLTLLSLPPSVVNTYAAFLCPCEITYYT